MRLEHYHKTGVAGCCPNEFYVIIFNQQHEALKDNAGVLEFAAFVEADQGDYANMLAEHTERTRFYYLDIDPGDIDLPANTLGSPYTMEIWQAAVTSTPDRTADTLVEVREFFWDGSVFVDAQLAASQIDSISQYSVEVAATYDSNTSELRCMASLHKNGLLITDSVSLNFRLIDRTDTELINSNITQQLTERTGVFHWSQLLTLAPDEAYAAVAIIEDADGNLYESASTQLTWD